MIELIIVGFLGIVLAIMTYKKNLLSLGGSLSVLLMLLLIDGFGNWKMVLLIVWAYLTLSIIDKVFDKKIEESVEGIHEKSGKRVALQVWVNGGAAVAAIIAWGILKRPSFMIGYIIAIGEAYADSLASDVGVMSTRNPIDICTLKPIKNGLSGGISILGTGASFLGVVIYTVIALLLINLSVYEGIAVVLVIMSGCLIDSILGSRLQVKYICKKCNMITEKKIHCGEKTAKHKGLIWMDNSMVNLLSNAFTCLLGVLFFEILQI